MMAHAASAKLSRNHLSEDGWLLKPIAWPQVLCISLGVSAGKVKEVFQAEFGDSVACLTEHLYTIYGTTLF